MFRKYFLFALIVCLPSAIQAQLLFKTAQPTHSSSARVAYSVLVKSGMFEFRKYARTEEVPNVGMLKRDVLQIATTNEILEFDLPKIGEILLADEVQVVGLAPDRVIRVRYTASGGFLTDGHSSIWDSYFYLHDDLIRYLLSFQIEVFDGGIHQVGSVSIAQAGKVLSAFTVRGIVEDSDLTGETKFLDLSPILAGQSNPRSTGTSLGIHRDKSNGNLYFVPSEDKVNLRAEPKLNSKILRLLNHDTRFVPTGLLPVSDTVSDKSGFWLNIVVDGTAGWIWSYYTEQRIDYGK